MNSGYSYKEYQRRGKIDTAMSKGDAAEVKRQEGKLGKLEAKIAHHEQRIADASATIKRLQTTKASANWSPSELKDWMDAKKERREAKVDLSYAQNGHNAGNLFKRLNNWLKS